MANKKKCEKCGVPLEGLFSKLASVFGVKPSTTNPGLCNKCDNSSTNNESEPKEEFHSDEFSKEDTEEKDQDRKEKYSESGD